MFDGVPSQSLYHIAQVQKSPALEVPADKRITLGWRAFAVAPSTSDETTLLRWFSLPHIKSEARFRITVALDVREEKLVQAVLPSIGEVIGTFDIRYSSVLMPVEMRLTSEQVAGIARDGVELRMVKGDQPLWILEPDEAMEEDRSPLLPHLLMASNEVVDAYEEFFQRMCSIASIQQFGWMEGCVLDGLYDLRKRIGDEVVLPVIERHLVVSGMMV